MLQGLAHRCAPWGLGVGIPVQGHLTCKTGHAVPDCWCASDAGLDSEERLHIANTKPASGVVSPFASAQSSDSGQVHTLIQQACMETLTLAYLPARMPAQELSDMSICVLRMPS